MLDKQKFILDFIHGPLQKYLTGGSSYGKFIEEINELCGTDFRYSDLYPSYLFNAELHYPAEEEMTAIIKDDKQEK